MALGRLRVEIPAARWVPPEQIHLTLSFLGEVQDAVVERLTGQLSRIQLPSFPLCLGGTGCFPNRQRPRVLWIGLDPQPRLNALAAKVREAVLACGIPQEQRPFSPHITLARLKMAPGRELDAFFDQNKRLKLPMFTVREFILFQSLLTSQGALHIPLKCFSLEEYHRVNTHN